MGVTLRNIRQQPLDGNDKVSAESVPVGNSRWKKWGKSSVNLPLSRNCNESYPSLSQDARR